MPVIRPKKKRTRSRFFFGWDGSFATPDTLECNSRVSPKAIPKWCFFDPQVGRGPTESRGQSLATIAAFCVFYGLIHRSLLEHIRMITKRDSIRSAHGWGEFGSRLQFRKESLSRRPAFEGYRPLSDE